MTANELRQKFLDFMKSKGHTIIPSASLVPENDPTTLFISAGMQPMIPYLLGEKHPGGKRLANIQKCFRTVDIDDVGDNRHNTFFEMMGNWSLNDYFKKESIPWSWEFLTKPEWLGLDPKRFYVTVFKGEDGIPRDDEAIKIWQEVFEKNGIKAEVAKEDEMIKDDVRIIPMGVDDNLWIAGATGPCGGDTEIFYDVKPEQGKLEGNFSELVRNFRIMEVWNNVFMAYDKKRRVILVDGINCLLDEKDLSLNKPLHDLLISYEARVIVVTNVKREKVEKIVKDLGFELFTLEHKIEKDKPGYYQELLKEFNLKKDEVLFFDHNLASALGGKAAGIISEHCESIEAIRKFIDKNIVYFEPLKQQNVDTGMGIERTMAVLNKKENVFDTELFQPILQKIALLMPTISTPNLPFSEELRSKTQYYEVSSEDQKIKFRIIADHIRASVFLIADGVLPSNTDRGYILRRLIRRAVRYGKMLGIEQNFLQKLAEVVIEKYGDFYKELKINKDKILEESEKEESNFHKTISQGLKKSKLLMDNKSPIDKMKYEKIISMPTKEKNEAFRFIYANKEIKENDFKKAGIDVSNEEIYQATLSGKEAFDLFQTYGFPIEMIVELVQERNLFVDIEDFEKELKKHQELSRTASVGKFKGGLADASVETTKLHTAAHLLLAALREILGGDIFQKGSNITAERLRFDFNYPQKMTAEQIKKVEDLVNQKIQEKIEVQMTEMPKAEALKISKTSFDPAKYGDTVKVYKINDFSVELCGGPHVKNTKELGHFKITKEESSSAGVRRIKAVLE